MLITGDYDYVSRGEGGIVGVYAYDAWAPVSVWADYAYIFPCLIMKPSQQPKSPSISLNSTKIAYHYGQRFYNPQTGKWMSRDPIGEEGGLLLYVFVGNNSIGQIDPWGLAWSEKRTGGSVVGSSLTAIDGVFGPPVTWVPVVKLDSTCKDGCYRASIASTEGGSITYLNSERDRAREAKHVLHARTIYYEPWDKYLTGISKCFQTEAIARRWITRLANKSWDAYADTYRAYTIWFVDVPDLQQILLMPINIARSYYLQDNAMQEFIELRAIEADP